MTTELKPDASSVNVFEGDYKIIVIEDDDGLNRLIQKKLQKEGYQTDGAMTGQEALAKTSGNDNEVLLIDYKLPDMTGKQLTKKIIEKFKRTPSIIVITGFGDEKIAVEMMKLGVWDYMVKEPDFIDILPEKIKHICADIEKNNKLKKAEEDLRKTLEVAKDTGAMARVGGWEVDLNNNTVFWTQSTKKIHEVAEDYTPTIEEAINFFHGESKTKIEEAFEKAIRKGIGYDLELQFVTAKGNKLWVHAIGKPEMKDEKCVRLRGTFQDITERKNAEKRMKFKRAKLKRTEKIAHIGSWDWDIASDTVTWSEELFRIFKLNPEFGAPSYKDHPKIYTPESMKNLDVAVQKCLETGEPYQLDLEIIRGDGTNAFCTGRGFAKKNSKGDISKLFGSFQDITERKEAEAEIKKSEEKLKLVIDNSPFPIAVVDEKDQKIQFWSKSARQLFGHNPKTSEEWYTLAYPDLKYRQEVIERWKPFLETAQHSKKAVNTGEYDIHCKDGTVKICELYAQFIPGSLVVTLNDITERIKAEEQLKAINQQLQASNQQLSASEQQLLSSNQQLAAANQQLQANEQQLRATVQQLEASEQQLRAANQQLQANEQQLRAANQQLNASDNELRDSKETAERYLNISAEIILSLDSDGNITLLNDSGYQLLGYEAGELTGKDWINSCLPKERKSAVRSIFEQMINGEIESLTNYESNIITKAGEIKTILWHNTVLKDTNGKITGTLSSGEDITERVKAVKELAASESFLKAIFDKSLNAILVANDSGNYISVNEAAANLFGYPVDELLKMNVSELLKTDNPNAEEKYKHFVKEGVETGEIEITTPNVQKKFAHYNAIRIRKDFNLSILSDITERKKAEEERRKSDERFRIAQEVSPDGFTILQPVRDDQDRVIDFTWVYENDAIARLNGTEPQNIVGKRLLDLFPGHKNSRFMEAYKYVAESGESTTFEESYSGETMSKLAWFRIVVVPMTENIAILSQDITERKETEMELIKAKEKAEEADRLKSAFLANMSHEIRTPMNGIIGFTSLLQEPNLSGEKQQKFIEIIKRSGDRMLNTVNDIIDVSKIETGQMDISLSDMDVCEKIENQYNFFKLEAETKGLKLLLRNLLPDDDKYLNTDKRKFNSIISNLIKNAIKYTDKGSVEIGCSRIDNQFQCYVKDTGIGIPESRQKAVFDRFVQADIADTHAFQGSGLGLAICKAYVEMLGGKIWLESEEGVGSQFYFTIPFAANHKKIHLNKTEDSNGKLSLKKGLKVLIVDDDEFVITYLRIVLEKYTKQLLVTKSGTEAVELCRDNPDIDIVLMDIKVPGINGYEATRQIREFNKEVFILAQTAYAQSGDRNKSIEAGCNDYISKPIKKEKLLEIISDHF